MKRGPFIGYILVIGAGNNSTWRRVGPFELVEPRTTGINEGLGLPTLASQVLEVCIIVIMEDIFERLLSENKNINRYPNKHQPE